MFPVRTHSENRQPIRITKAVRDDDCARSSEPYCGFNPRVGFLLDSWPGRILGWILGDSIRRLVATHGGRRYGEAMHAFPCAGFSYWRTCAASRF